MIQKLSSIEYLEYYAVNGNETVKEWIKSYMKLKNNFLKDFHKTYINLYVMKDYQDVSNWDNLKAGETFQRLCDNITLSIIGNINDHKICPQCIYNQGNCLYCQYNKIHGHCSEVNNAYTILTSDKWKRVEFRNTPELMKVLRDYVHYTTSFVRSKII
jgi:hypothetical protein